MNASHHALWVALGFVSARAQHTAEEAAALARWAKGRRAIVEVGVAEGASALVLRRAMDASGDLWLVDPFHLSRNPFFNTMLVAARRTVGRSKNGRVHFIVGRSPDAAAGWARPLDLVFVDGDHSYAAVLEDWHAWSPHVVQGGVVLFHDAVRESGRPTGPAEFVDDHFRRNRTRGWDIVDEAGTLVVVKRS